MAEVVVTPPFPAREAISSMAHRATTHRPFHLDPPLPAREVAIPIIFHRLALATIHRAVDLKAEALVVPTLTGHQARLLLLVRHTQVPAVSVIHLRDTQVFLALAVRKGSARVPMVVDPVPVTQGSLVIPVTVVVVQ